MTLSDVDETGTKVELVGAKTRLREFRTSDGPASYSLVGDDRVTQFMSFDSRTREMAQAGIDAAIERAKVSPRTEYWLATTRLDDDTMIGNCRLAISGVQAAKLGYAIAFDHWGKGFATDAARAMITFGFATLDLHRITAAIGPENEASQAVVEKLGFAREGVLRDHVFTNGVWRDSVLYSVLRDEWAQV